MQEFFSINFLKNSNDSLLYSGNPHSSLNEIPVFNNNFHDLVNEQIKHYEDNSDKQKSSSQLQDTLINSDNTAKPEQKELNNVQEKGSPDGNQVKSLEDKKSIENREPEETRGNENESINKERIHIDDTKSTEELKNADKKSLINLKEVLIKKKVNRPEDIHIEELLKDLLYVREMIEKLNIDKTQLNEIKSLLSEFKTNLKNKGFKNNNENFELQTQLKNLLYKFRNIIEKVDKQFNLKMPAASIHSEKDTNKTEAIALVHLKKEIKKLENVLRQYLTEAKPEGVIRKSDVPGDEIKNIVNHKLVSAYTEDERKDVSQTKENTTNFNFQFNKKEADSSGNTLIKSNLSTLQKPSSFKEHLDNIVQNARIVIRDSKNGSFSIRLHPESLGRININLNLEHGVIIGKFLVDNTDAREVLLENMLIVKERLQGEGISVGEFQVNVRGENNPASDSGKKGTLHNIVLDNKTKSGHEYEFNSSLIHDGSIDLVI